MSLLCPVASKHTKDYYKGMGFFYYYKKHFDCCYKSFRRKSFLLHLHSCLSHGTKILLNFHSVATDTKCSLNFYNDIKIMKNIMKQQKEMQKAIHFVFDFKTDQILAHPISLPQLYLHDGTQNNVSENRKSIERIVYAILPKRQLSG